MEEWMVDSLRLPIQSFQTALLQMDRIRATEIFEILHSQEQGFEELEHLTMEVLERIGTGWENGQLSLSQVYMSGVICEELMDRYVPESMDRNQCKPRIAIAVLLDHHALGKRIVCSVLKAAGYDVVDLGQGLSAEEIVEKTLKEEVDILLISTLMLSSALKVRRVVAGLREQGSLAKIVVGGAPFRLDSSLWQKVNADADGKNGTEVIRIIERLAEGG
jgi:methylmalonyl-CoA mutase cobalamin-binding domain/chain